MKILPISAYNNLNRAIQIMLKKLNNSLISLTENGILPDFIIRFGIRLLLKKRLLDIKSSDCEDASIIKCK